MESIINQTYPTLEIILVDDGSTDRSPQLCDAYAKKDSRIRVVQSACLVAGVISFLELVSVPSISKTSILYFIKISISI